LGRSTSETGADKAVAIRRGQQKERTRIAQDIEAEQKKVNQLMENRAPIAAEVRKVEAEVGPIKYIAAFLYGENPDANILEKAVTWVIILIVVVFDPLAVVMLLAAQMTFAWIREERELKNLPQYEQDDGPLSQDQIDQLKEIAQVPEEPVEEPVEETIDPILCYKCGTELLNAAGIGPFCPNRDCDVADSTSGNTVTFTEAIEIVEPTLYEKYPYLNKPWVSFAGQPPMVYTSESDTIPTVGSTERSNDYVTEPDTVPVTENPTPRLSEAAPGRNRGIMHSHEVAALPADNAVNLGTASSTDFGTEFPANPVKGDIYLRVDYLPNRLFKFNGDKWIEVDREQKDLYAYNEMYIKYLIDQIAAGKYDTDSLNELEREQIAEYLKNNA
jgi:hypothetical protein